MFWLQIYILCGFHYLPISLFPGRVTPSSPRSPISRPRVKTRSKTWLFGLLAKEGAVSQFMRYLKELSSSVTRECWKCMTFPVFQLAQANVVRYLPRLLRNINRRSFKALNDFQKNVGKPRFYKLVRKTWVLMKAAFKAIEIWYDVSHEPLTENCWGYFFFIFYFSLFFYILKSNNEGTCDTKAPAPFEKDTDHPIPSGESFAKSKILSCDCCGIEAMSW